MKSIIQNEKVCYITGGTRNLHCHHVFYGAGKRQLSEKYGLKIWLKADLHNMSDNGVHFNKRLDLKIKKEVQQIAMEYYNWSVDDFRAIFGKSYI